MILRGVEITPGLRWWIEHAGDEGPLEIRGAEVLRADGSALSEGEEIEVLALLAAHAAESLTASRRGS